MLACICGKRGKRGSVSDSRIESDNAERRRVSTLPPPPRLPPLTSPRLWVFGINPRTTTGSRLEESFQPFGPILEAKVVTLTDPESEKEEELRGLVIFEKLEDAEKARKGMNGRFIDGWVVFCEPATEGNY